MHVPQHYSSTTIAIDFPDQLVNISEIPGVRTSYSRDHRQVNSFGPHNLAQILKMLCHHNL